MPRIDLDDVEQTARTGYPPPFDAAVAGRFYRRIGEFGGLSDFGVSHVVLKPGAASSQRHWHQEEDELVVMVSGVATLIDDDGRTPMRAGDIALFPKGAANGHHLVNEGQAECVFVAVGRPAASDCHYPDVDLHLDGATQKYRRKDGRDYTFEPERFATTPSRLP